MLELKNIIKNYYVGDNTIHALRGVDLKFRENEFVSILGPSGCGKTTLLNIIGGLDGYTSGDLVINGTSTKNYKDRDWDSYRNHSVGFVFQSYNLIPHQTVLGNVEIALTVSGVGKQERRQRAIEALEQVGLGNQLNKRPNQLSGGQMQRVAIARALVNDPDIILADEPTGALDTETSVQVMEILKKISDNRLIVMVTHNPELAEKYSSRIIRMLDGEIKDDSMPLTDEEYSQSVEKDIEKIKNKPKKEKKPSMSWFTAFRLSLRNLFTKKGRTTLTSFAGSIGIMGIALILAVSQGTSAFIDDAQEDSLSSYPLTIQKTTVDLSTIMSTFMNINNKNVTHGKDAVYKRSAVYDMFTAFNNIESNENDIASFKKYLEKRYYSDGEKSLSDAINGIQYSYDLGLLVYTKNVDGDIIKSDSSELFSQIMAEYMGTTSSPSMMETADNNSILGKMGSSMSMAGNSSTWQEMLSARDGSPINDLLKKQYDVIYGRWPSAYNEVVLVVDENNELDDMTLYALGLQSQEKIDAIMDAALKGTKIKNDNAKWSYKDICDSEFRVILNSDCYKKDDATGRYSDLRSTDAGLQYLYDNALKIKVTGIIRPDEDAASAMLNGSIAYTKDLTDYVIEHSKGSLAIKEQQDNPQKNIITGLPFESNTGKLNDAQKKQEFAKYISELDTAKKAEVFVKVKSIPDDDMLKSMVEKAMSGYDRKQMETAMTEALTQSMGMSADKIADYLANMSDEELTEIFKKAISERMTAQYAEQAAAGLSGVPAGQLAAMLDASVSSFTEKQCSKYYDEIMEFSEMDYNEVLTELGYVDTDIPSAVNIYASSFENKEKIEDAISEYNKGKEKLKQIKYTDYVGIMMSSITTIIDAITYVLLAFVAISLIVSSIMIGVITLISVQERTKEIGILRAIGASKRDVSSMFNAETLIIGFTSGLFGIVVTYMLCIPINIILHSLTGLNNLNAYLPPFAALILVLISMALSLIAGLIPSKSAAKKDPVVALRTE